MGILDTGRDFVGGLKNAGGAVVHAVTHPSELPGDAAAVASIAGTNAATFIRDPAGTTRKALANGFQAAAGAVDSLHTAFTAGDDFARWRAYGHFTSSVVAAGLSGPAAVKAASALGDVLKGSQLAANVAKGISAENDVSKGIGISRNIGPGRVTVPGSGPGGFRVPDFDPAATIANRGTVVEVKATTVLSSSPQLRDLVAFAQTQQVPLEIFTNATLPTSGELYNWVRTGTVIISPLP